VRIEFRDERWLGTPSRALSGTRSVSRPSSPHLGRSGSAQSQGLGPTPPGKQLIDPALRRRRPAAPRARPYPSPARGPRLPSAQAAAARSATQPRRDHGCPHTWDPSTSPGREPVIVAAVARAHRAVRLPADRQSGQHGPQRRATHAGAGSARHVQPVAVDRRFLRAGLRRAAASLRQPGRPGGP
jgi:hypothetical protein